MFSDNAYKKLTDYINGESIVDETFDDNDLKQIYNALAHPGVYEKEEFNDGDLEIIYDKIVEYW